MLHLLLTALSTKKSITVNSCKDGFSSIWFKRGSAEWFELTDSYHCSGDHQSSQQTAVTLPSVSIAVSLEVWVILIKFTAYHTCYQKNECSDLTTVYIGPCKFTIPPTKITVFHSIRHGVDRCYCQVLLNRSHLLGVRNYQVQIFISDQRRSVHS